MIGPQATLQLSQLKAAWKQGDHVLITGGTGSGKTLLARYLDQMRLDRGGYVVVMVGKLQPDATITDHYKGWTRWTKWKKNPSLTENKILLWPDVKGKTKDEAMVEMRSVFTDALNEISRIGRWTVHIDEGLLMTDPTAGLGQGKSLALMYSLMRSAQATMITLAQRPAHLPLSIYANLSHAFIGKVQELADVKRLANLDGNVSSRVVADMIRQNGAHDFVWIPVVHGWKPQRINLAR